MSGRESVQTYWVNGSTEISKRASDLAAASETKEGTVFEVKGNANEFVVQGAKSVQFWTGSVRSGENYIGDTNGDGVVFLKEGIQMVVTGGKVLGPLPAGTLHRCNTPPRSRSRSRSPAHRIAISSNPSTSQRPPHLPRSSSAKDYTSSSYRLASGSSGRRESSGGGHGHGHGSHSHGSSSPHHHDAVPAVGSGVRYVSGTSHAAPVPVTTTHTMSHSPTPPKMLPRSASYHPTTVPPTNTFPNSVSVSRECRECRECLEYQQQQQQQQQQQHQSQRRESHPRDSMTQRRDSHHREKTYQPAPHATTHATIEVVSYSKRHDGDTFSTAPTYLTSGPVERDWLDNDSIAPEDSISNVGIYPKGYPRGHPLYVGESSSSSRR